MENLPALLLTSGLSICIFRLVAELQTRRRDHAKEIEALVSTDSLTGLATRQVFHLALHKRLHAAEKQTVPFAVLFLDIDRFKELDTILGSENGDLLLEEFSKRLKRFQADPGLAARLSGDEFAILLESGDQSQSIKDLIDHVVEALTQPYYFHQKPIDITISCGYALFPDHGYKTGTLLQQTKLALLRAKQLGGDEVCGFEKRHDVQAQLDHQLSQEMGKAISRGEFCLHFQPQFSATTGEQTGFEALMRWNHPTRGFVSPASFIPIAESNGLILPLSEFALREACRTAAQWTNPLKVAVNLSPIQFQKTDIVSLVRNILEETGLAANRLELEVTESLFINCHSRTTETLKQLQAMGISIALDDFGTGYSSLSYLSAFPIDKIKIDRSFVQDLSTNEGTMAIVSAMIGIGKSLDMRITAEGIEDQTSLEILRIAGCHEFQGYLLGKPRDIAREPGIEMESPIDLPRSNVERLFA